MLFPESGGPAVDRLANQILVLYKENRCIGKANLDWQFDRYNRIKLGGEFTQYHIDSYSAPADSQAFSDVYREKPIRWNAFVEDRLDLGDVVVVGGVRYDCYETRARPVGRLPPDLDQSGVRSGNPEAFFTNDSLFPKDKSHDYMSPHVQVSFPVTERTNFRLSYAHQVQAPDFGVMLQGINTDLDDHQHQQLLRHRPRLRPHHHVRVRRPARVQRRHGARHRGVQQGQPVQRRRPPGLALRSAPGQQPRTSGSSPTPTSAIPAGIDVRLDRRFGNFFNGTLAYTYPAGQEHRLRPGHLSRLRLPGPERGVRRQPAAAPGHSPTDFSRPHNLALAAALNFPDDWQAGLDRRDRSCRTSACRHLPLHQRPPYTRCAGRGRRDVVSGR